MKKCEILVAVLGTAWFLAGCGKNPATAWSLDRSGACTQLKQFLATQETQARALAKQDGNKLPSEFDAFYKAAEAGDWQKATNLYHQMGKRLDGDGRQRGSWWSATMDADGVLWCFRRGTNMRLLLATTLSNPSRPAAFFLAELIRGGLSSRH